MDIRGIDGDSSRGHRNSGFEGVNNDPEIAAIHFEQRRGKDNGYREDHLETFSVR